MRPPGLRLLGAFGREAERDAPVERHGFDLDRKALAVCVRPSGPYARPERILCAAFLDLVGNVAGCLGGGFLVSVSHKNLLLFCRARPSRPDGIGTKSCTVGAWRTAQAGNWGRPAWGNRLPACAARRGLHGAIRKAVWCERKNQPWEIVGCPKQNHPEDKLAATLPQDYSSGRVDTVASASGRLRSAEGWLAPRGVTGSTGQVSHRSGFKPYGGRLEILVRRGAVWNTVLQLEISMIFGKPLQPEFFFVKNG